jgi:3-methylcrotonyl-CoA carboxylase alpha subunit
MNILKTIPSLLIANRGEIACRIIRTAKGLGIRTIAVYSDVDANALHVSMADEAIHIGQAEAVHSYLNIPNLIKAALQTGAKAVHPGYGFLSERHEFVEACQSAGLIFVGPSASAMRAMGLKDAAKALVAEAGVPIVRGYLGMSQDAKTLQSEADHIGYPLLIKAVAGGGGKGMKRVETSADFAQALASAQREAQAAFGDPRVLLEKYILAPRHIEMQIFSDTHGNAIHLLERDCSLQRRHQKVIEEAPAPDMPPHVRQAMGKAALKAAMSVGYVGAGTVEFIVDGTRPLDVDTFYFMEMNTRLQVEHPVTEMITGLDLVEWQLRIAAGEILPLSQDKVTPHGHAVEARLYAEDPAFGFLPSTGRLEALNLPLEAGIRVDCGVQKGDIITPFYDPMLGKIIAHGATRDQALERLSAALEHTWAIGITTNATFLKALIDTPEFRKGACDTGFIAQHLDALTTSPLDIEDKARIACAGALASLFKKDPTSPHSSPWDQGDAFQLGALRSQSVPLLLNEERVEVRLNWNGQGLVFEALGHTYAKDDARLKYITDLHTQSGLWLVYKGIPVSISTPTVKTSQASEMENDGTHIISPLQGKVTALLVITGEQVSKGQRLAVVEAMKMEHTLTALRDGIIESVEVQTGDVIQKGQTLMSLASL